MRKKVQSSGFGGQWFRVKGLSAGFRVRDLNACAIERLQLFPKNDFPMQ